jgi:hypothetical protein
LPAETFSHEQVALAVNATQAGAVNGERVVAAGVDAPIIQVSQDGNNPVKNDTNRAGSVSDLAAHFLGFAL